MTVEGKGRADACPPHDFKAHAIDEAQSATPGHKMGRRCRFVDLARHPNHMKDGYNIPLEDADSLEAQPAEDSGRCLDKDIVMDDKLVSRPEHLDPSSFGRRVVTVAPIKDCEEGARVDENVHLFLRNFGLRSED